MPFDRSKYPANWEAIRARIFKRAGDRCEWCGVANGVYRVTWKDGAEIVYPEADCLADCEGDLLDGVAKAAKIVLTTAHVHDPNPQNCDDENLAALCQRCHNRHDMTARQAAAALTRARKAGQGALL